MIMRNAIFIAVLLFSGIGCDYVAFNPGPDPATDINQVDPPPSVALGEQLYDQVCARCHGDDALGGAVFPFSIQGYPQVEAAIQIGPGAMPAFPNLSSNQAGAIQLYITSLANG